MIKSNIENFKKYLLKLSIFVMIITLSSCNIIIEKESETVSEEVDVKVTKINWTVITDNNEKKSNNFISESEVMNHIYKETGAKINVRFVDENDDTYIKKLIMSNDIPDMLTIKSDNINYYPIINSNLFYDLETLFMTFSPKDAGIIPHKAWKMLGKNGYSQIFGIPGGIFSKFIDTNFNVGNIIPREGFFVREDVYEAMGRPDLSSSENFIDALNMFMDYYALYLSDAKGAIYPVLFGNGREGIKTLQHAFGILPVYVEDEIKHRIFYDEWTRYLEFINQIGNISDNNDMIFSLTNEQFEIALKNNTFMYIGSTDYIHDFNSKYSDSALNPVNYIWIDQLNISEKSTVSSYNSYGEYLTFVYKSIPNPKKIIDTATFLLSEEGSLLVKYGIEERHWISNGQDIIITGMVKEWKSNNFDEFARFTGIGIFPYLADRSYERFDYFDNSFEYNVTNINPFENNTKPIPTTPEGIIYDYIEEQIFNSIVKSFSASSEEELVNITNELLNLRNTKGIGILNQFFKFNFEKNMSVENNK